MLSKFSLALITAALATVALAPSANGAAALVADYQFQDGFSSTVPGAPDISNVGNGNKFVTETVGCNPTRVLSFPRGSGLELYMQPIAYTNWYSVVVDFRLSDLSNNRRIIGGSSSASTFDQDSGLYQRDGKLMIYDNTGVPGNPFFGPTVVFASDTYAEVAFTYAATGVAGDETVGYVNGVQQTSYPSAMNHAHIATWMWFFKDNGAGVGEDSAGAVSRIRVYTRTLAPAEVAAIHDAGPLAGACNPANRATAAVNGKVKVKGGKHGRLVVLTGIDASCPAGVADCSGTAAVDKGGASQRLASNSRVPKHLGKTTISVAAGQTQAVKVKLTRKASEALRAKGKLKVKISVSLASQGGAPAVASRTAKLKHR